MLRMTRAVKSLSGGRPIGRGSCDTRGERDRDRDGEVSQPCVAAANAAAVKVNFDVEPDQRAPENQPDRREGRDHPDACDTRLLPDGEVMASSTIALTFAAQENSTKAPTITM
jgi:hypothetical protein